MYQLPYRLTPHSATCEVLFSVIHIHTPVGQFLVYCLYLNINSTAFFLFRLSLLVRNLKNPLFPFLFQKFFIVTTFCLSFSLPPINVSISSILFLFHSDSLRSHEACSALIFFIWRGYCCNWISRRCLSPDMAEICFLYLFFISSVRFVFLHSEGLFSRIFISFGRFGLKFSFKLFRWA